ncbi:hypothetical protein AUR65_010100 [Haloferax marisrubri]|uniref:Uncharacterized protein n=1 Tax=Haloferax marisrubri TaxID=1544719 RepID=A0A2P4NRJ0_9EURY|nr:hypothetical protein AUR65_010100 [Haloferax marisrubri]
MVRFGGVPVVVVPGGESISGVGVLEELKEQLWVKRIRLNGQMSGICILRYVLHHLNHIGDYI